MSLADEAIELYTAYGLVSGAVFNGLYEQIQRHMQEPLYERS